MDAAAVKKAVEMTGGKLITVEDHYAYVSQNKILLLRKNFNFFMKKAEVVK